MHKKTKLNREINIQEFISRSKPIEICYQPPMVSNGCAVHIDNGWQLPPTMSCATWYCNDVQMPIPTYICGATFVENRIQGRVAIGYQTLRNSTGANNIAIANKNNLLNGTCVKLSPQQ